MSTTVSNDSVQLSPRETNSVTNVPAIVVTGGDGDDDDDNDDMSREEEAPVMQTQFVDKSLNVGHSIYGRRVSDCGVSLPTSSILPAEQTLRSRSRSTTTPAVDLLEMMSHLENSAKNAETKIKTVPGDCCVRLSN